MGEARLSHSRPCGTSPRWCPGRRRQGGCSPRRRLQSHYGRHSMLEDLVRTASPYHLGLVVRPGLAALSLSRVGLTLVSRVGLTLVSRVGLTLVSRVGLTL